MALTAKQARFIEEYLVDLNATQAAIRAGYSEKTAEQQGYQLLQKTSVQRAIEVAVSERSERTKVDQDWVIERLIENVDRSMQAAPVKDRDGNSIGEFTYQGSVANKSLELLGRHLGMFTDKIDAKVAGSIIVVETGIRRE